ncbi:hypothetical protein [Poseidonibacter ostreae]|uniref:DUF4412 domain-containing protein n=1 Tax=Poseidonibacter ostreae TaxID=2654171 RepID=A0ABQ6VNN0_9BACT|nr:hypothetical protein [Poseidonibacter ostreae]KAB7890080.1 hypothetical protein GBG18_09585 [Poseidonibacter ostreae]
MNQLVQYKDAQHVLITTDSEGEQSSQLLLGDKRYIVMKQGGKSKYMDMDVMMEQMKQMSAKYGGMPEEVFEEESQVPDFKIVKKGESKTVAGIKGQVWTLEYEEEGKQLDLLVTDDDKVVDAVHKYMNVMTQFTQGSADEDGLSSIMNIEKGYVTIAFEGMELVKFDDAEISDSVYALPASMNVDKKTEVSVKKPPLCPLVGSHGEAQQLLEMLKPEANGWKQLSSATCMNMMKTKIENAIYQKGDYYIHINLSINAEDEKGMVGKYRINDMEIKNYKKGKIQGKRYQAAYLKKSKHDAMDIRLENAMLTMTTTRNDKVDLVEFSKAVFDLSKFIPVEKSKATADDALKSLGGLFDGGTSQSEENPKDTKTAEEMLKGLFGKYDKGVYDE